VEETSVDNLTVRPRWYSGVSLFMLGVTALLVVLGFSSHPLFLVAAFMAALWVLAKFGTRIVVTPADVSLRQSLVPRRSAPREAIKVMHWFSYYFTFVDDDHRVLLKIASLGWSRGQLLDLSEALGVHLYNHRTKGGFGTDAQNGRIMERAANAK
jgi:hypothetical protein